jgi:thioredoxin:protein disulfide reductase
MVTSSIPRLCARFGWDPQIAPCPSRRKSARQARRFPRAPVPGVALASVLAALVLLLSSRSAQADSFAEAVGRGAGSAFLFALTAGLLTALTPCVYPMIPITISVFGGKGVSRRRAFALATLYVAGIAVMFGTLGTIFALVGKAFGTFLANPWVVVPLALFFVAMAVSMFGAFELALPMGLQQRLSQIGGRGFGGAFLMGLVGGLIAAPCTGPPLAGILAYVATTRDAINGFLLLSTYAAGIGVPFWLIAGFSMQLPRSGRWMESVKSLFGIALLVAALYYLKIVVPPLADLTGRTQGFLVGAMTLVLLGLLLGAVHLSFHGSIVRKLRKGLGVALAVMGLFAMTNYLLTPKVELAWIKSETEAVSIARAQGRPMVIDFMADWCLPCKELEVQVFSHPDVVSRLQEFTLLKVDLTREDEDDTLVALKEKYGVNTLPAVRIVTSDGRVAARIDSLVTVSEFLQVLAKGRS